MVQTNSVNLGDFSGSLDRTGTRQDCTGSVTAYPISGAGDSEVVFGIRIMPQTEMDITFFDYSSNDKRDLDSRDVVQASAQFAARLMQMIQVTRDGSKVQVINGHDPIHAWVDSDNITPAWTADGEATVAISPGVSPAVVYTGGGEDPGPRKQPNLDGDAAFSGHYMQCSGSGGSSSLTCYSLANVSSIDMDLRDDFDGENGAANAEDRLLEKTGSLTTPEVPFLEVARFIDRKATSTWELISRSTGTSRPWTITRPPGTTPFTTHSSEYLTGDSGRILINANPSAGYLNLLNEYDCLGAVITDSAGPSRDLAAEHILEPNLVALGWQFITTGAVPAASQALSYSTVYQDEVVPWSLMGGNSVFTRKWDTWDPNAPAGTHDHPDLSPERERWDAIGSVRHPEYMVNLQQTLNAFKSRMMRGISGIGLDRWVEFNFDDTSEATGFGNAIGALSEARHFLAVINYLNHPTVHDPFIRSLNRINAILEQFDAAVAWNDLNGGTPIYAALLWRKFIYVIVVGRTEASQGQYRQWLQRIQSNWLDAKRTANANNASPTRLTKINTIVADVSDLLAKSRYDPTKPDLCKINTAGLFPAPF